MDFGKKLLEFRARHDLTQKQVADIIGTNVVTVCRYEHGSSTPTMKNRLLFGNKLNEWEANKNDDVPLCRVRRTL